MATLTSQTKDYVDQASLACNIWKRIIISKNKADLDSHHQTKVLTFFLKLVAQFHFLSHQNVCYINRFANLLTKDVTVNMIDFWSTDHGFKSRLSRIFSLFFPKMRQKVTTWHVKVLVSHGLLYIKKSMGECTARVKLELTDFSEIFFSIYAHFILQSF